MSSGQRYRTGLSASKKSGALHRGAASTTRLHEEEHRRGPRDDEDFEKNTKKKKNNNTGRIRTRDWAGYTRTPSSVCNVVVVVIIISIIIIPLASLSLSLLLRCDDDMCACFQSASQRRLSLVQLKP